MIGAVRRAQPKDVGVITECFKAAYAQYSHLSLPDVTGGLAEDVTDHLVWVYATDDMISGGIVVGCEGASAQLHNIAVRPEWAGQGIAKTLITTALEQLKAQNIERIDLATHVDMAGNLSLYKHLGWQETERAGNKVLMSRKVS